MQPPLSQRSVSSTTVAKIAIASTLAIGCSAIATPARAAFFYDSSLTFSSSNLNNFYSDVNLPAGSPPGIPGSDTISLTFPTIANVGTATGAFFDPLYFPTGNTNTPYNLNSFNPTPTILDYVYKQSPRPNGDIPIGYSLGNDLDFVFANGVHLRVGQDSLFTGTYNTGSVGMVTINAGDSYFENNGDVTPLESLVFTVGSTNNAASGSYTVSATTKKASVPEPFTVIGTLVGGAAAMRMRKKLAADRN